MRFAVNSDHKDFFHKHRYICFEDVLSKEQIQTLLNAIESTLSNPLKSPHAFKKKESSTLYKMAHDLFRNNDSIRKLTQKTALMSIAAELFELWSFRIAFDQYISTEKSEPSPFDKELSLEEISSIHPLAGVMLIQLKDTETEIADFPLPKQAGSLLFFSPEFSIPWPSLYAMPGLSCFLVAFAKEKAFFRADTVDPHAVDLKNLGYVFGDQLKNTRHPILFKSGS